VNAALIVARAAQAASALSACGCVYAAKAHHPLMLAGFSLALMLALVTLLFANLARRGDDPRPHPPGCECEHERNH
jgi:hypothetical protein